MLTNLLYLTFPFYTELTDLKTCLEIFTLREEYWNDDAGLQKELAKRSDTTKQMAPTMLPNLPVIGMQMFTQCKTLLNPLTPGVFSCTLLLFLTAAFRYGPYIAHFSLKPTHPSQTALSNSFQISSSASPDEHSNQLRAYFSQNEATYDLIAQFSSSLENQPVEDASVVWDEATAPWLTLGQLRFDRQESLSAERREWWENENALSPFNALEEHRPLGSINRLRKRVYEASRDRRAAVNGKEVRFPKSASEMPN